MIIDLAFVDLLMIFASAMSVVLRASRHMTRFPLTSSALMREPRAAAPASPSVSLSGAAAATTSSHVVAIDADILRGGISANNASSSVGGTASSSISHRFGWHRLQSLSAAVLSPMRKSTRGGSTTNELSTSSLSGMSFLQLAAQAANVFALISNSLTHLLRHSEVLYAAFLTACDVLIMSREHPSHRLWYFVLFVGFLWSLFVLNQATLFFWVGDMCGYAGGLIQLFLLGSVIASINTPMMIVSSPHHTAAGAVIAEYTLERCAACVSSLCYLSMLLDEGEAVYSSHREFIRWYGSTLAMLIADVLQLWRFVSGKHVIEASE